MPAVEMNEKEARRVAAKAKIDLPKDISRAKEVAKKKLKDTEDVPLYMALYFISQMSDEPRKLGSIDDLNKKFREAKKKPNRVFKHTPN